MDTTNEEIERLTFRRRKLFDEAEAIDNRIMALQRGPQPDKGCGEEPKASTRIADEVRSDHQAGKTVRKPPMTIQRKEELFKVAMGVAAQIGMQTDDREEASFTLSLAGMLIL